MVVNHSSEDLEAALSGKSTCNICNEPLNAVGIRTVAQIPQSLHYRTSSGS